MNAHQSFRRRCQNLVAANLSDRFDRPLYKVPLETTERKKYIPGEEGVIAFMHHQEDK